MRNAGVRQIDFHQILLRRLNSLSDGLRYFLRLPRSVSDDSCSGISHYDQSGEREVLASLDDFRNAVNGDYLVFQLEGACIEFLCDCWHSTLFSIRNLQFMNL